MINRQLVHFDTAGNRVIINPGEMTNTGGDNWDITPSGYIPTTSATSADVPNTVALRDADGGFSVGNLQVDTTPPVVQTDGVGKLVWNDTDGTVQFLLKGGNVVLRLGQEEFIRVKNDEGSPLVVGDVVYLSGANGTHALVKKASATTSLLSDYTIGMVVEAMANNAQGWVAISGYAKNLNTNHLIEGAPVWLSTVSGQTTSTKPTAPNHSVFIGLCVRKNTNVGSILLAIRVGYELGDLDNVFISGVANNDILMYDGPNNRWTNVVPATARTNLGLGSVSVLAADTDGTLAANSDLRVATQKATKTYADTKVSKSGDTMTGALIVNATGSTVGTGTLAQALVVNAGGPTGAAFTSNDIMVMKADRYPYFQFINNTSGGTVHDGFKIGIEDTYALIAVKEAWDLRFWTNNLLRLTIAATGELTVAKGTTFQANIAVQGTGSTIGSGALANQLVINGGGPAITSADLFVIKAAGYPYMQFVNNNSGGTVNDGFKIGLENTYALFAMKENWDIRFWTNNTDRMRIQNDGKVAIGSFAPTAMLHIQAGTATANTAPLKFTSGTLMTTPEAGAVEFLTDKAYLTITTGAARKELALADTALTSGQSPTITTNGRLTNSNKFDIYATGTTNGTAGSVVNLNIVPMPTNGQLRFLRITVKALSAAAPPDSFGRTLDAMWANAAGVLTQVGADQLGTALTTGNLAAATIATTAAGTNVRVTCTDVTGCGAVVTWQVFGEYY